MTKGREASHPAQSNPYERVVRRKKRQATSSPPWYERGIESNRSPSAVCTARPTPAGSQPPRRVVPEEVVAAIGERVHALGSHGMGALEGDADEHASGRRGFERGGIRGPHLPRRRAWCGRALQA